MLQILRFITKDYSEKGVKRSLLCKKTILVSLLCVLLVLPAVAETYTGQAVRVLDNAELYFRLEPNKSSPISDTIKVYNKEYIDHLGIYTERNFILLENNPVGWHKVAIRKRETFVNQTKRISYRDLSTIVCYVDEAQFNKNVEIMYDVKSEGSIYLYARPDKNSIVEAQLTGSNRIFGIQEIGDKNWVICHYQFYKNMVSQGYKKYYINRQNLDENAILYSYTWGEDNSKTMELSDIVNIVYIIGERTTIWIILLLFITFSFFQMFRPSGDGNKQTGGNFLYITSVTLFLTICILEILYALTLMEDMTWFCDPRTVGWLWAIINFFLFGGLIFLQILYIPNLLSDIMDRGKSKCNMKLGYYSLVLGLICLFVVAAIDNDFAYIVVVIVGILQLIQIIKIFKSYHNNLKSAFLHLFVYLFGGIATLLILIYFIKMAIIVVILLIVVGGILWLIYGGGFSSIGSIATIFYRNGSSEKAVQTGVGITGEKIYEGQDTGNTIVSS